MTWAKFLEWRALSLKINDDEIGENEEGSEIYIGWKMHERQSDTIVQKRGQPTYLSHVFKHLIKAARGIAHKWFSLSLEQKKINNKVQLHNLSAYADEAME